MVTIRLIIGIKYLRILHICYRMIISKELFGIKLTKIGEKNGQKRKDTFIYVFKRIYSA